MRTLTVETLTKQAGMRKPRRHVPMIRLKGSWLEDAGIRCDKGQKVCVKITNEGLLLIPE
jgi:hypothetical protein